ncbi:hypothetical protein [Streptomyces sp. AD55]|uniref:hypothetical protein n=1 Tax=Streptomyces sp. AD55 TaxID=3242895 RepID=UPI0035272C00
MRALSRRAFPEAEQAANNQPAPIEQAHTKALRRACAEHAARAAAVTPQRAPLRTSVTSGRCS